METSNKLTSGCVWVRVSVSVCGGFCVGEDEYECVYVRVSVREHSRSLSQCKARTETLGDLFKAQIRMPS